MKTLTAACAVLLACGSALMAEEHAVPETDQPSANTVLAVVNGTEITLGELIVLRSRLSERYNTLPPDVLFEGLLDQLIQQQLLADTLQDSPARLEYALTNEERSLKAGEVVNTLNATSVTEEALQEAYDARFDGQEPATEYNASHILVETEEEALEVLERLNNGAEFGFLAREYSIGPSGPNGGALGWFTVGVMVPEFEAAVLALEVGEVSAPVKTDFGWHIVTLLDQRDESRPTIEQLRDELIGEVQRAAIEARIEQLEELAEVDRIEPGIIDPAVLNNLELLEP